MKNYKFSDSFIKRYEEFLSSPEYLQSKDHQKTDYWESQSTLLKVDIKGNKLSVEGSSGFYVPKKNLMEKFQAGLELALRSPFLVFIRLRLSFFKLFNLPGYLSYSKAFNMLMAFNPDAHFLKIEKINKDT